jgi:hypothetical protein
MGRTYFLDLQTLLAHLQGQSCVLTTTVSHSKMSGMGTLILKNGTIISCTVHFQNGTQLGGQQAYTYLEQSQAWQVHLEQDPQPTPSPSQPSAPGGAFAQPSPWKPRQKRLANMSLFGSLQARQRMLIELVLAQINGQRTVTQIKEQLQLPPEVVDEILSYLHTYGLIE